MPDLSAIKAMLNIIIDTTSSAVAYVDIEGRIRYVQIGRRSEKSMRCYQGKSLAGLLRLLFGERGDSLYEAYRKCASSREKVQITRFEHENVRNSAEYFDWRFVPVPQRGGVIITVCNVAETYFLEQEITAILEQNEAANRQLFAAMANVDFQLMDLDQAHKRVAALYRITSIVQRTVDEREVMEEIVEGITTEFGFPSAAIFLVDDERRELVCKASRGYKSDIRVPYGRGVMWRALLSRELVYIPDVSKEPDYVSISTFAGISKIAIPLFVADKVIGVLDVETTEERPIQPYDLNLMQSLASQAALTIVHAQHVTTMEKQAITDELTGLYNYRYFLDLLDREFKRSIRYQRPLSILMIDIDHFKKYNDTYGHIQGNEVLRQLAAIVRDICRELDTCIRYGGEEFVVLLPETNIVEAYAIAERIRTAVAAHPFSGGVVQPEGALTVSIGIAAYPEETDSEKQLLECADTALYIAKRSNRNCVVIYPGVDAPEKE